MEWAALISWIVTAAGGFVLLTIWVSRGGMQARGRADPAGADPQALRAGRDRTRALDRVRRQ